MAVTGGVRRHARAVPLGVALLACLSACAMTPGDDEPGAAAQETAYDGPPAVMFGFEDAAGTGVANEGSLAGAAEARVANGGQMRAEPGPDGHALRFPAFDGSPEAARAVMAYWSDGGGMDPRDRNFRFGADFVLDAVTQGENDDGNNLVQRGLNGDGTQFKLQADNGLASCYVEGDLGSVTVRSEVGIEAGTWYGLTCSREGDEVALVLRSESGEELDTVTRGARIGSLVFERSVPLTMGGKLTPEGTVVRGESDQLNGALDNVFVHVE